MAELTPAEEKWLADFKRVMKKRPATLGLWGGSGDDDRYIDVVALDERGEAAFGDGIDDAAIYVVEKVACPSGGGAPLTLRFADLERPWVEREATER